MEYSLDQVLDINLLQSLQDKLNAINPFPSALIDNDGNILTATAWQDVCTRFHRNNRESEKECILSDRYIRHHLQDAGPAVTYKCPHGLVDNAIPIIVEGRYIASFFTGQFFLEPPDLDFFRKQAVRYGFEEDAYLEAVQKVPVWNTGQLHGYLDFMKTFTESMAAAGLNRLREKEAKRLVLDSEHRFRAIIENAQAGYFFIDREGIIRDGNDSYVNLYKYNSREEIIGHHFAEIQRMDDLESANSYFNHILAGDPAYLSGELSRKCKDGSTGYHTFSAMPVIRDGVTIGIEGFLIDITRERLAEIELDISKVRLTSVFDKMIEGFALHEIICDEKGLPVDYRFLDMNPAFEKLTGLKASEISGKTAHEVLPELEASWIERYGQVALTGVPVTFEMFSSELKRQYRVVAFSNQTGQFATIFDDITDRFAAENELRESETKYRQLADLTPEGILIHVDGTIRYANISAARIFGAGSPDDLLGRKILELVHPDFQPVVKTRIYHLTDDQENVPVLEEKLVRLNGEQFFSEVSAMPFKLEGINAVQVVFNDISERKKNEEELIAAKEKAEESDRLKSAFLANISHEIRTPMNSILGFSELLEEMVDDPKQEEYLRIIVRGGERLLNIINAVIDIAKIESGEIIVTPAEFDVNALLHELYELNKRRNVLVRFVNEMEGRDSVALFTDKTKLFQILNNLISNALKFTRKGFVKFGYITDNEHITFYVKDTGIGIDSDFKGRVFERFQKADIHDRTDFEGTGLGLAITKELVSLLGGNIWFESEPGRGTEFFVRLGVNG